MFILVTLVHVCENKLNIQNNNYNISGISNGNNIKYLDVILYTTDNDYYLWRSNDTQNLDGINAFY